MEVLSILPSSPHRDFDFASGSFDREFSFKLKIDDEGENFEEEEEREQEFSFACANPQGSIVTADEIFHNGQIRPTFPVFDQSLLFAAANGGDDSPLRPPRKKVFVEKRRDVVFPSGSKPRGAPEEPLYELSRKTTALEVKVQDPISKEMRMKSNSTGFSKLWKLRRDLKLRSNSHGEDAFVFLNPPAAAAAAAKAAMSSEVKTRNGVFKNGKRKSAPLSAHEKLYLMNRKRKETDKRRSFLPYRQQVFGFFTNVNVFSKNLHPF